MSANQQSLRLNVYVHGQLALSMEANPDRPASLGSGEAMPWLSSTWSGDEERVAAQLWLLCCLPENGALEQWVGEALATLRRLGGFGQVRLPETVLWAHPDSEYPGALSLSVGDAASPPSPDVPLRDYERLGDADLESLLQDAIAASGGASGRARPSRRWPMASLSGMRPKTAATLDNGVWRLAPKGHLNTAIVKVEDSRRNPGEAGIESLCQQALRQLGLRAAPTQSQVIAGLQCVISERSDRAVANGRVVPIHQEDFRQAGDFGPEKYPAAYDSREMKGWAKAYQVLRQGAEDPDAECDALTRFLAATWMLGHGDLHRGNLDSHAVSLARTMSKLRALGMSLMDAVRAVTVAPARAVGLDQHGFGQLTVGKPAYATVFEEIAEPWQVVDAEGEQRTMPGRIETRGVAIGSTYHEADAPL